MKTYLECIPCFFRQALEAARLAGADEKAQKRILDKVALTVPRLSLSASPPEIAGLIYSSIRRLMRTEDPFKKVKEKSNRVALKVYPLLKKKVSRSRDRLFTALNLAVAGNIIDYGAKNRLDVDAELKKILKAEEKEFRKKGFSCFDYKGFKSALEKAETVMYLADNAGETVFDRLLIEEIKRIDCGKEIIYAVKEKPVINDALSKDAIISGIASSARIVSSGSCIPGTVLSRCSGDFRRLCKKADMVISKGQGNFESFTDGSRPVYYLLMAKCPAVARDIGCEVGDFVLRRN